MEVERGTDHDVDTAHGEGDGHTGPCHLDGNKRLCLSALLRELSCDLCFAVNPTSMPWLTLAHLAKSLLLRGLLTFELSVGQL